MILVLLAAVLRLYRLDYISLRGDEAFSVLEWAQSPDQTWADLAHWEPHPVGTFMLFWAWKAIAGESEFAMRLLPLLVNLVGVAAMLGLGRRHVGARYAWMLGLLWAVNPFLVWHSQDVRNYAIWAALSPLAMLAFLVAVRRNRPREWGIYGVIQVAACYAFLLEPFFMLVQGLYLLWFHREKWRLFLITWLGIALALIPLLIQLTWLSNSDYPGTASKVNLQQLVTDFFPTLLFGETRLSFFAGISLIAVLVVGLMTGARQALPERALLGMWLFLPLILLSLVATKLNIFLPRYIIPVTAPLLLLLMRLALRQKRFLPALVTFILAGGGLVALNQYFYQDPPKAPDWRGMTHFIENRARPGAAVITGNVDPGFTYYYDGAAVEIPVSMLTNPTEQLAEYNAVFVQTGESTFDIALTLQETMQYIPPAMAMVKAYRPYDVDPAEIQHPLDIRIGEIGRLRGYTVYAADDFGLTVFLYWEPLTRSEGQISAFMHVSQQGTFITSDDHVPLQGEASPMLWNPGDLLRDPFFVTLPPGKYTLAVGMYEAETLDRLPIYGANGDLLGDSLELTQIVVR